MKNTFSWNVTIWLKKTKKTSVCLKTFLQVYEPHTAWRVSICLKKTFFDLKKTFFYVYGTPCCLACVHWASWCTMDQWWLNKYKSQLGLNFCLSVGDTYHNKYGMEKDMNIRIATHILLVVSNMHLSYLGKWWLIMQSCGLVWATGHHCSTRCT